MVNKTLKRARVEEEEMEEGFEVTQKKLKIATASLNEMKVKLETSQMYSHMKDNLLRDKDEKIAELEVQLESVSKKNAKELEAREQVKFDHELKMDVHTEEDDDIIMSDGEDEDGDEDEGVIEEREVNVLNNPLKGSSQWKRKMSKELFSGDKIFKATDLPFFVKIGGEVKVESGEEIVLCLINKAKLPTHRQTRMEKLEKFIKNKLIKKWHPDKFNQHLSKRFHEEEREFAKQKVTEICQSVIAYREELVQLIG